MLSLLFLAIWGNAVLRGESCELQLMILLLPDIMVLVKSAYKLIPNVLCNSSQVNLRSTTNMPR
ncbi:hypothetical protein LINGRAHAP2_LOCUS2360 [Linum grandiflorum]